ncbi:MAG: hypothetical protein ACJAVM_000536 [Sulfitobacter sp.]|jgi:hypothetical protein
MIRVVFQAKILNDCRNCFSIKGIENVIYLQLLAGIAPLNFPPDHAEKLAF